MLVLGCLWMSVQLIRGAVAKASADAATRRDIPGYGLSESKTNAPATPGAFRPSRGLPNDPRRLTPRGVAQRKKPRTIAPEIGGEMHATSRFAQCALRGSPFVRSGTGLRAAAA